MGIKLYEMEQSEGSGRRFAFFCPGCKCSHPISSPRWAWNQSFDKPTFQPSLMCNRHDPKTRCHSFITDGRIEFLSDCGHALRGQTVDLPDWESML